MVLVIIVVVLIFFIIGLVKYFFKNGCNFCGIVVEKIKIWIFLGKDFVILLMVLRNFIFRVIFVLLIIKVCVLWIVKLFDFIKL